MSSSPATRASARRAASSRGESPRRAKASDADSSPQAKTCNSSDSEPKADLPVDRSGHDGFAPCDAAAAVSFSSRAAELGDPRPVLVALHDVAGLVKGPQRLRKEAVIQVEFVIDNRPL